MPLAMDALYVESAEIGLNCLLCPHNCLIGEGKTGICKVRRNRGGRLIAESWGKISSMHVDPVEKKPLYHFHPGKNILSIGGVGCNMHCKCCQNWQISQASVREYKFGKEWQPEEILNNAIALQNNIGVAYTYNEPGIWFEFMLDIAQLVSAQGLKNVMVSNGYINENPLRDIVHYIDAFNIDLKGFTDNFYRSFTGASLAPVLQTLKHIRKSGRHLEITCLIIPTQNDDPLEFSRMINWITNELGDKTILHISAYHPAFKLNIESTTSEELEQLVEIACKKLFHVYTGNIRLKDYQNTKCSICRETLIRRNGYLVQKVALMPDGTCSSCGNKEIIC